MYFQRSFVEGEWNSLIMPVNLTKAQFDEAFGSDAKLAKANKVYDSNGNLVATYSNNPNNPQTVATAAQIKGETGAQGPQGETGATGAQGPQGEKGEAGRGIESVEFNIAGELVIRYTDNSTQNLGTIPEPPQIFKYELLSNNTYSISAGDDSDKVTTITIPETYKGKAVTEIAEGGFSRNNNWTAINIPKSIVKIGKGAFATGKAVITICPTALSEIDSNAFPKDSTIVWDSNEISNWECSVERGTFYNRERVSDGYVYKLAEYGKITLYRYVTVEDGNMHGKYFSEGSNEDYENVGKCSNSNYSRYYTNTVYYRTCKWKKIS